MDALIVSLFFIPGFFSEYLFEKWTWTFGKGMHLFKILRGLAFNIPITLLAWFVIWFWKVALHGWPMIANLNEFWLKSINETFLAKYVLVVLVGIVLFAFIATLTHRKRCRNERYKEHYS